MASKHEQSLKQQAKRGRRGNAQPTKVPGATEVTTRKPSKPRARANPEPHPERRPVPPPKQPTKPPAGPLSASSRPAWGHIQYDGVRVKIVAPCPWCDDAHTHKPGDATNHTCAASGNRYSVLIPLQAFEALR